MRGIRCSASLVRMRAAASLAAAGAEVQRGSLEDLDSLRRGASESDGVIHTAFIHDFSKFAENCEIDRRAIEALGSALEGSERPCLSPPELRSSRRAERRPRATRRRRRIPRRTRALRKRRRPRWRHAAANVGGPTAAVGPRRRRSRLRSDPHRTSRARRAFRPMWATGSTAGPRCTGSMRLNFTGWRWRRVPQQEPGITAIAEEGVPFRDIAEVIGRRLNVPVVSKTPDGSSQTLRLVHAFRCDRRPGFESAITRERLGWRPKQPGLIADIDRPRYFEA